MKLTEKIAYMKGLLDGMELDGSTKEGKAILQMAEVMEEMGVYIDDLQSQVDELTELCDLLDKDLGEVETDLYCDDDEMMTMRTMISASEKFSRLIMMILIMRTAMIMITRSTSSTVRAAMKP